MLDLLLADFLVVGVQLTHVRVLVLGHAGRRLVAGPATLVAIGLIVYLLALEAFFVGQHGFWHLVELPCEKKT
jgi:hypothetical protein